MFGGSLYGTTSEGGQYGGGTLFGLAPQSDLVIEADASLALLAWKEAARGMKLQKANGLTNPDWHEVPGAELTNRVTVPLGEGNAFFRLAKP